MTKLGLAEAAIRAAAPLHAAIYTRVSKDKRGDQRSVEDQDTENREVCDSEGWQVAETFCDNDVPASRFGKRVRQEWDRLLVDLAVGRFHVLVMWESSRGDRRLAHWVDMLDLCRDLGVLIHITSHERTYDVRRRRDYKTLAEEGLDSADDSEKTSERLRREKRNAAKKGLPGGPNLYGYKRIYRVDEKGKRRLSDIVPDEEPRAATAADGTVSQYTPAGVVREIFRRVASGDAVRLITVDLNGRGIPSPRAGLKGWASTRVREIATNPAYIGKRVHQGVVLRDVQAVWPALIDTATFQNCARRFKPAGSIRKNEGSVMWLMSGLAVCGVCGRVVRRMGGQAKPRYVCSPENMPGVGYCVSRRIDLVDAYVQKMMWLRLARADIVELLAQDRVADERHARIEADIDEKQVRLDAARASFKAGRLPIEVLEDIVADLGPEIERAREQLNQARVAPVIQDLVGSDLAEIEATWWRKSVPQRREIIRVLTERVVILPLGARKRYAPEESVRIVWR